MENSLFRKIKQEVKNWREKNYSSNFEEIKEILKYKKQTIKLCKNKSNRLKKIYYEPNKSDSRNIQLVNKQSQMINSLESMIKKLESSLD